MAWHTLNEAVKLTGRSRRSIYRDMATGLVSYGVGPSGMRQLETSELIRAYGALETVAHPGTAALAHLGTPWHSHLRELGTPWHSRSDGPNPDRAAGPKKRSKRFARNPSAHRTQAHFEATGA